MKNSLLSLVCIAILGLTVLLDSTPVMAHSVDFVDPFEMALSDSELIDYYDDDPWKGTVSLTVTNTGLDSWGDFHFQINDPTDGSVIFRDDDGVIPSMGGVSHYSYEIVNGGLDLNFFFYDDPVSQYESVTFDIYTDNTSQMPCYSSSTTRWHMAPRVWNNWHRRSPKKTQKVISVIFS